MFYSRLETDSFHLRGTLQMDNDTGIWLIDFINANWPLTPYQTLDALIYLGCICWLVMALTPIRINRKTQQ